MVFAPLTRCKHKSSERCPAYPLSSSSIRGLSLFPFERVTLIESVGRSEQLESDGLGRLPALDLTFPGHG